MVKRFVQAILCRIEVEVGFRSYRRTGIVSSSDCVGVKSFLSVFTSYSKPNS